jgi:hypothetical protein
LSASFARTVQPVDGDKGLFHLCLSFLTIIQSGKLLSYFLSFSQVILPSLQVPDKHAGPGFFEKRRI